MNSTVTPFRLALPKTKASTVTAAVETLAANAVIDDATRERILSAIEPLAFDWRRLARYAFLIGIVCVLISIGAVLADAALLALLQRLLKLSWGAKAVACALLATALFLLGVRRRARHPGKIFSNETIFFGGVLGVAGAVACLGRAIDTGSGHFSLLILAAAVVYAVLGLVLDSRLIWVFGLLSLGGWFGAETGYVSGWGAYYLGMAYPLRFVCFGVALTLGSLLMLPRPRLEPFFGTTRVMGLLYLFIALWILSIWGNYNGYEAWHRASHLELAHWSLYLGLTAAGAIYLGLKHDDAVLRGFGLTFLGIELYTKFFEYFWDGLHKAIFFAVLAVSFWLIGSRAESIWQLRALKEKVRRER